MYASQVGPCTAVRSAQQWSTGCVSQLHAQLNSIAQWLNPQGRQVESSKIRTPTCRHTPTRTFGMVPRICMRTQHITRHAVTTRAHKLSITFTTNSTSATRSVPRATDNKTPAGLLCNPAVQVLFCGRGRAGGSGQQSKTPAYRWFGTACRSLQLWTVSG